MLITFEGPEGAGKSTVLAQVAQRLEEEGRVIVKTREPGAGKLGREIRRLLLEGDEISSEAELMLFLADRANHGATVIRPALDAGHVVLCDRYTDSTLVYQGYARGFSIPFLRELNDFVTRGLRPSLTVLFDISPEKGLARITDKDRLDLQPIDFHRKVREGFLALADEEPDRWRRVDADRPVLQVVGETLQIISMLLSGQLSEQA